MSILVGQETRLLVQGITGREGEFHTRQTLEFGTAVVAGVTPGKGGTRAVDGRVPVFETVADAVAETGANTTVIYVPASSAPDAIAEAVEAGLPLIVCITEGIPTLDMLRIVPLVEHAGARLIGANCPGLTSPATHAKVGIIPGSIHRPGSVGVVSRSGTLTYEVVQALTDAGIGQSTCVGIGGDAVPGTSFVDVLALFRDDPETEAIVLIGEIGGSAEEEAAAFAARELPGKPMVAFIAGRTAPEGRRMGHAGAIISGGSGTAQAKVAALEAAGIAVAETPSEIPTLLRSRGVGSGHS
jgi:succinyl-CoA synthetase alpha subunit